MMQQSTAHDDDKQPPPKRRKERDASDDAHEGVPLVPDGEPVPDEAARAAGSRAETVCLADVEPEAVTWLWEGRIPLGKLAVLDGDPGLGKSTMCLDIAARVTRGDDMPDGTPGIGEPAAVLMLSAEDGAGDTIRPRLDAAGADVTRAHIVARVHDRPDAPPRPPELPTDVPLLLEEVQRVGARLIVIDPLMAYLGGGVDSYRDQDVRRALHPLSDLAEVSGCAVLVVRHRSKAQGGKALYSGGGSIGIIGAARSGLIVERDPQDPDRRVLATTKCNVAKEPASLSWGLESAGNGVARVVWHGESPLRADELMRAPLDEEERSQLDEACDFLADLLNERGGEVSAKEGKKAARDAGIADRTLERARSRLGVKPRKGGFGGAWYWVHPAHSRQATSSPSDGENGDRGENGDYCGSAAAGGSTSAHSRHLANVEGDGVLRAEAQS